MVMSCFEWANLRIFFEIIDSFLLHNLWMCIPGAWACGLEKPVVGRRTGDVHKYVVLRMLPELLAFAKITLKTVVEMMRRNKTLYICYP